MSISRPRRSTSSRVLAVVWVVVAFAALTTDAVRTRPAFAAPSAPAQPEASAAPEPQPDVVTYRPPVEAPVDDPFRAPTSRYGPGNRGIEYATEPGTPIVAAAAGEVVFAGAVAGTLHVTLLHTDGVRTSYSFLDAVQVADGARVPAGHVLGLAGTRTFFSARLRDAYLDPSVLLAASAGEAPRVRLVPDPAATPDRVRGRQAREMLWLAAAESADDPSRLRRVVSWARNTAESGASAAVGLAGGAADLTAAVATEAAGLGADGMTAAWALAAQTLPVPLDLPGAWKRARAVASDDPLAVLLAFVEETAAMASRFSVVTPPLLRVTPVLDIVGNGSRGLRRLRQAQLRRSSCTQGEVGPPPIEGRRILVLVGGLGSSSEQASIDELDLGRYGYPPSDIVRFSYRGGRIPGPSGASLRLEVNDYEPVDTLIDIRESAHELAQLLRAIERSAPGVPVDVAAHSLGGVVSRLAVEELLGRPLPAGDDGHDRGLGPVAPTAATAAAGGAPSDDGAEQRLAEAAQGALPETLATIGSPHQGADIATALARLWRQPAGMAGLELARSVSKTPLHPAAPAIQQLSERGDLVTAMRVLPPLPDGVASVAIGARADVVVGAGQTLSPGTPTAVVAVAGWNDHANLPRSPAVAREVALAVGGLPPSCESWAETLADVGLSELISTTEDVVGSLVADLART